MRRSSRTEHAVRRSHDPVFVAAQLSFWGMPESFVPVAVTARNLTDYRLAFGLDEDSLTHRSFADVASGASSFAAELRSCGGKAVSVDPLYRTGPAAARDRARHNLMQCERWLSAHSSIIDWDHLGSAHGYRLDGLRAADMFHGDFATHPEHYVAAALPRVPLPDGAVDVALCANFLFAYADVLTVDFHVDAIVELARLARCELLVHPANHRDGSNIDSFIAEVRDRLAEVGLRCSTFAAPGSWLRDAMTIRATK